MDTTDTIINKNTILGKIIEILETHAVIETDNSEKIIWPITKLPKNSQINQRIHLKINSLDEAMDDHKHIANEILNQILKTTNHHN